MYFVSKRMEVAGAHFLKLDYKSPCETVHGHNWIITVYCSSNWLNENGMVIDFKKIKELVMSKMDHKLLNDQFNFNPTAENIARWICNQIESCYKVTVQESEGNIATYKVSD